jgi:3-deoxy-D-manno-octulosonic-acid transferase
MASASLWLYRILLGGLLPVALPVITLRQKIIGKSRPRFRDRLARSLPELPRNGLWIQAVSVGEVELARRLVAELEEQAPEVPLFLTATTATGLGLARRSLGEKMPVFPCPIDLPGPVARVLDAAQPQLLVLVETELWPEMLYQAGHRRVPVAVVNARLSPASFAGYRRVAGRLRTLLEPLALVLARSEADAERFAGLNVPGDRILVAGNVKYDLEADQRPLDWENNVRRIAGGRSIMVAGSTMEGEEAQVLDALEGLGANGAMPLLILAPRHPERFDAVARLLAHRGVVVSRRSSGEDLAPDTQVFLIDTIGELARAYRLADIAFIGGSLVPTGGHNPLEPAVWGVPVLSGPHVHNFKEVYDEMIDAGGARLVADSSELRVAAAAWLDEPQFATAAGESGREVVERNRGATARTVSALLELMSRVE